MSNISDGVFGFIVGILIMFFVLIAPISCLIDTRNSLKEKAIEVGAARYNPTSGEFEWLDDILSE